MRTVFSAGSALTIAAVTLVAAGAQPAPADDPLERARALTRAAPLIDGHNDYAWAVREEAPTLDLAAVDIRGAQPRTMTDIPRLRAGGVGAQFWSVYVPVSLPEPDAVVATMEQIDAVYRLAAAHPSDLAMAFTASDVERAIGAGKIASLIGVEGG